MRIAMVSEHADPLAAVGGVDAGGQNVHVAALAAGAGAPRARRHRLHPPRLRSAPDRVRDRGRVRRGARARRPAARRSPRTSCCPTCRPSPTTCGDRWRAGARRRRARPLLDERRAPRCAAAAGLGIPVLQTFHALGTVKRRAPGREGHQPGRRGSSSSGGCAAPSTTWSRPAPTRWSSCARWACRPGAPASSRAVWTPTLFRPVPGPEPGGPPRLLVVGRLVERKGVGNAIEALAALPDAELVVAGGPPRRPARRRPGGRSGCAGSPASRGRRPGAASSGRCRATDVPALIRSADVVVAVPWYEPFGIVPLEAMACGRPVVGLRRRRAARHRGRRASPASSCRRADPTCWPRCCATLLADADRRARYGRPAGPVRSPSTSGSQVAAADRGPSYASRRPSPADSDRQEHRTMTLTTPCAHAHLAELVRAAGRLRSPASTSPTAGAPTLADGPDRGRPTARGRQRRQRGAGPAPDRRAGRPLPRRPAAVLRDLPDARRPRA